VVYACKRLRGEVEQLIKQYTKHNTRAPLQIGVEGEKEHTLKFCPREATTPARLLGLIHNNTLPIYNP